MATEHGAVQNLSTAMLIGSDLQVAGEGEAVKAQYKALGRRF